MSTPPPVHLFQIAYSAQTLAEVPAGFVPLDNLDNPRPDWYEYWPIRQHLLNQPLEEEAFYGFFSPKFCRKTQLAPDEVRAFVQRHAATHEVMLFSPQPDMSAFFMNVFEQGETFDPQLVPVTEQYLQRIGRPAPLRQIVMDARQIVFSNYFVARPAFWREWLAYTEPLFALCEARGPDPLKDLLEATTTYRGGVRRKVFVMERMVSLLLAAQPRWRAKPANPFTMGWSKSRLAGYPFEAVMSDALKFAFREHRWPQYIDAYFRVREQMHAATNAQMAGDADQGAAAQANPATPPATPATPADQPSAVGAG